MPYSLIHQTQYSYTASLDLYTAYPALYTAIKPISAVAIFAQSLKEREQDQSELTTETLYTYYLNSIEYYCLIATQLHN